MINEKIESNGGFIFKKIVEKFSEDRIKSKFVKVEKIPKKNWHLKKKNKIKKNY